MNDPVKLLPVLDHSSLSGFGSVDWTCAALKIPDAEALAAAVIREEAGDDTETLLAQPFRLTRASAEAAHEHDGAPKRSRLASACELLYVARESRQRLQGMWPTSEVEAGNLTLLLMFASNLRHCFEDLKSTSAKASGSRKASSTKAERDKRIRAEVHALIVEKKMDARPAYEKVAKKHGVSWKTVQRLYVSNSTV